MATLFISVYDFGSDEWSYLQEVPEDITVQELKERLFLATGIPVGEQRICGPPPRREGAASTPSIGKSQTLQTSPRVSWSCKRGSSLAPA
mmetsp:Transcript_34380/g.93107  ORF Transcript_34380/g.93107 Transcript_34380/m.93107 type:complete len:90 (-) Transcript_34380:234-503(-)